MKQKSDDEKEKVTEKVKEEVKREENMSGRSEKKPQSIYPRAYRPEIIQREEGQESALALQKNNKFLMVIPIPNTPPKS